MLLGLIFDCAVEWQDGDCDNHEVGPAPATIHVGCFTPPSLSRDGASPARLMLLGLIFDCAVEWQDGLHCDNHEVGPAPATIPVGCFTPPSLSRWGVASAAPSLKS